MLTLGRSEVLGSKMLNTRVVRMINGLPLPSQTQRAKNQSKPFDAIPRGVRLHVAEFIGGGLLRPNSDLVANTI